MKQPFLFAALLALGLPGLAQAATLNVPAQYPTIQAAINASANGDTVLVTAGTYTGVGNRDIDFNGKSLTVTSQAGPSSTIIDCGGYKTTDGSGNHRGFYFHSGEKSATIIGFTVKNGYEASVSSIPDSGNGGGIYNASNGTLTNCTVSGNTAQNGGGIYKSGIGTTTLTNCTVLGNTAYDGGGIYKFNPSGFGSIGGTLTLTNCTVSENTATHGGGGIGIYDSGGTVNSGTTTLTNSIFYGDTGGEVVNGAGNASIRFSDIKDGYSGTGNINADPKFVSAADVHLQPGSPCLGMGTVNGAPATDLDGNTRPSPPSIGAYEGLPAAATTTTLMSSQNPSTVNQSVTFVASVAATGKTPTGTAQFNVDGTQTGAPIMLDSTGKAIYVAASLTAGTHKITVSYMPTQAFASSTSNALVQNVNAAPPVATTHVLWDNVNGAASIWNYSPADGSYTHQEYGPYAGYTAAAIADGGTDGKTRVLWNKSDSSVSLWSLDNTAGQFAHFEFGPYANWTGKAVSVAADNTTHVLWTNTNGSVSVWNYGAASGSFAHKEYGPFAGWTAKALADGPDGKSRLLWTRADGTLSLWSFDNTTGAYTHFEYGPFTGWTAGSISVGADNTTHVLWNNTNGAASVWNENLGSGGYTHQEYGPYAGWTANALSDGADGKLRVLWDNADGRLSLWSLDNATSVFGQFTYGGFSGWTATSVSGF